MQLNKVSVDDINVKVKKYLFVVTSMYRSRTA